MPWNISSGFSQGVQPLVGYNYASGNGQRMRRAVLFSIKVSGAFMVLAAIFCHQSAGWLISMFMENESIVAYGTRFLQGFSLGLPFLGIDFLAVGVFQACGLGKNALIFAIMRKIVLEIPALCILNYLFPLYGLAYAQLVAEVVLCIAAVVVLRRLFRSLDHREARAALQDNA